MPAKQITKHVKNKS